MPKNHNYTLYFGPSNDDVLKDERGSSFDKETSGQNTKFRFRKNFQFAYFYLEIFCFLNLLDHYKRYYLFKRVSFIKYILYFIIRLLIYLYRPDNHFQMNRDRFV